MIHPFFAILPRTSVWVIYAPELSQPSILTHFGTELSKIRLGILFLFDSITSGFQRKFEHKFTLLPGDISVVFMSTSKFRKS